MYVFVLEWTPAISEATGNTEIPHGYIFASFMVAIMIGSSIFKLLSKYDRPESFMRFVLVLSLLCLGTPILWPENVLAVFLAFVVFEICVGIFWPAMGFMRGIYIPESTRATIMNFCRVPLNSIVIFLLLQNLPQQAIFLCCVLFLVCAAAVQQYLHRYVTLCPFMLSVKKCRSNIAIHKNITFKLISKVCNYSAKQRLCCRGVVHVFSAD
ncbi:unnamed protein product [Gongylonema pulchrum]|uniref:MFS domain-containing protein n=1 Tax=Gongylonema pulchrum TaxID=637853 RepID=A0A183CYF6_9BILA|nr:unnamed protein product [Gongylonema pulchrum]